MAQGSRGSDALYYEVRFSGLNRVTVQRFKATKQSPAHREPVAFILTHEVLAKLVDDLVPRLGRLCDRIRKRRRPQHVPFSSSARLSAVRSS